MARGRFITLEGGEGAGKSTQVALLNKRLQQIGTKTLVTREPGGAPGAEDIRSLLVNGATDRWTPMAEALLNYAARTEHLQKTILPALDDGIWVICDRFFDSTTAYQGYGHGLDLAVLEQIKHAVLGDLEPDLTMVLDMPLELGLQRATARGDGEDRYERMGRDFHRRLQQGFKEIARLEPDRCHVVDASGDIEDVSEAIWQTACQRLGLTP